MLLNGYIFFVACRWRLFLPDMFGKLYNLYWFIRYNRRNKPVKRRYYRYVSKEKNRLIALGADAEEIRLLCRHLANPRCEQTEARLEAYRKTLKSG